MIISHVHKKIEYYKQPFGFSLLQNLNYCSMSRDFCMFQDDLFIKMLFKFQLPFWVGQCVFISSIKIKCIIIFVTNSAAKRGIVWSIFINYIFKPLLILFNNFKRDEMILVRFNLLYPFISNLILKLKI